MLMALLQNIKARYSIQVLWPLPCLGGARWTGSQQHKWYHRWGLLAAWNAWMDYSALSKQSAQVTAVM